LPKINKIVAIKNKINYNVSQSTAERLIMNSFIYLVDFGEVVKVGVSKYPEHRFRVLSKQFDLDVVNTFIYQTGNAFAIEAMVKSAFTHKVKPWGGVTTETFSCSLEFIRDYITSAADTMEEPSVSFLDQDCEGDDAITLQSHINLNYDGKLTSFANDIGSTYQQVQRWIKLDCIWFDDRVYAPKTKRIKTSE